MTIEDAGRAWGTAEKASSATRARGSEASVLRRDTFALAFVIVGLAATAISFTSPAPWIPQSIAVRIFFLSLVASIGLALFLAAAAFLGEMRVIGFATPRGDSAARSSVRKMYPPLGAAILLAALSGLALLETDELSDTNFRVATALVLFLGYGWAPLVAWVITSIGETTKSKPSPLSGSRAAALQPLIAFGLVALVVTWTAFAPIPVAPITIDGNMTDWASVPDHADRIGDGLVVVYGPTVSFPYRDGRYEARLNVTNSVGVSAETQVVFDVPNLSPKAIISPPVVRGLNASFDASASVDPDGSIVAYVWTFGDGASGTGVRVNHTYYVSGSKHVGLKVFDDAGATTDALISVYVTGPNRPPVPAVKLTLKGFSLVANSNRSTDPECPGCKVSSAWKFGDGTVSNDTIANHDYPALGNYVLNLTVTDDGGASGYYEDIIHVPNAAPIPSFSTQPTGPSFLLDGRNSSDPDGMIVSYVWTINETRAGATAAHLEGSVARYRLRPETSYIVSLTVIDNMNDNVTLSANLSVGDASGQYPPVPLIRILEKDLFVTFSDNGSYDPNGRIDQYAWDFGDGNQTNGPFAYHLYPKPDLYTARFTIIDNEALVSTISATVDLRNTTANSAPPEPHIKLNIQQSVVDFSGIESTTPFGSIVSYRWTLGLPLNGFDLIGVKIVRQPGALFLLAETAGDIYPMSESTAISFYVQTSADSVGFAVGGIHANFALRIQGFAGRVFSAQILWFFHRAGGEVTGAWVPLASTPARTSQSAVEARILLSSILVAPGTAVRVTCAIEYAGVPTDLLDRPMTV